MRKLLIIDDEENMLHMLEALLSRSKFQITTAQNGEEALVQISEAQFDYILCDIRMPGIGGLGFLDKAKGQLNGIPVIMMSAYGSIDTAIEAMKAGAYDFISKPFKKDEVLMALNKAEEREFLRKENQDLRKEIKRVTGESSFRDIIWKSEEMGKIIGLAKKVAQYDTTVLITGESGTGKELIAQGIHHNSLRTKKHFFAINCGSIPSNLLESELFGYVKGAFTGADSDKKGLFEEANGSTLFLDEIGELPVPMQVKLLRVLQENEVQPVGATNSVKVDVRILAATSRDLEQSVDENLFRNDLYYRLNVIKIELPPLRNRVDDIPVLVEHFVESFNVKFNKSIKNISPEIMTVLLKNDWLGNVRELENSIQRAVVLADDDEIQAEYLGLKDKKDSTSAEWGVLSDESSLKEAKKIVEAEFIKKALRETGGNKSNAAKLLELSYPSLLNKIKEYKL